MLESSRLHPDAASAAAAAEAEQADRASQLLLRLCCELTARWPPNAGLAHLVWGWQWQAAPAWRCGVLHEDAALPDLAAWCSAEARLTLTRTLTRTLTLILTRTRTRTLTRSSASPAGSAPTAPRALTRPTARGSR